MRLYELKCKECGAPLTKDGRCDYCGARYVIQNELLVQTAPCALATLRAQTVIQKDYINGWDEKEITQFTLDKLRQQLADGLTALMKVERSEDPFRRLILIRGEVRVAEPDFRFDWR